MGSFIISLLNLCLIPFQRTDNLIIFVPVVSVTIIFLFSFLRQLMRR